MKNKNENVLGNFFTKFLHTQFLSINSVTSFLGVSSFRVTKEQFISFIKESFKKKDVEAEFSYINNKHLHYKPTVNERVSFGSGNLYIRIEGDIFHFVVIPMDETSVVIMSAKGLDTPVDPSFRVNLNDDVFWYKNIVNIIEEMYKERV